MRLFKATKTVTYLKLMALVQAISINKRQ